MNKEEKELSGAIGRHGIIERYDQPLRPGNPVPTTGDPGDYRLKTQTAEDIINHPQHYQLEGLNIEAKHVIKAVLGEDGYKAYCKGNMIKYALRKKWDADEDVAKIGRYSQMYRGEDE